MKLPIDELKKSMLNKRIPVPKNSTLSGHAAGEPFDKHVYKILKAYDPDRILRHFEYLNMLFTKNPDKKSYVERMQLFPNSAISILLSRGRQATTNWQIDNKFSEKQNDTADIVHVLESEFRIIDVKTRNVMKNAQAPNIISAYKLAKLVKNILEEKNTPDLSIHYVEIEWKSDGKDMVCKDVHYAELFKEDPKNLYINWSAANQIQFHVKTLKQEYKGDIRDWSKDYLKSYIESANKRMIHFKTNFIDEFLI